jgi:hypothetical protein
MIPEDLQSRVATLEKAVAGFSEELRLALRYIPSDAGSSLTKSRIILERLLLQVYAAEMGRQPKKPLLGDMLLDNQFTRKIERRVLSRMNAIRDMGNLGPHGESVQAADAARVLDDLCEVLDWYLQRYEPPGTCPGAQQPVRPAETPRRGWPKRARIIVGSACGLLLILAAILYYSVTRHPRDNGAAQNPSAELAGAPEPIRVQSLDVLHNEGIDARRTRSRGPFGKETFGATPEDDIKVTARLTRPAYCYLIVFRPDGVVEVLYPQSANDPPEQTDEPRYPSKDRSKVYGLTDGTGLWLVALVASDQPLPPYADWRRQHPGGPWAKSEGEANLVWLDDGNWLEARTPAGPQNRGTRGEKQAVGTSPVVKVVDWLKAETGGVVWAVGFTVEARR